MDPHRQHQVVTGTEALCVLFCFFSHLAYTFDAFVWTERLFLCLTVTPLLSSRSLFSPSPPLLQVKSRLSSHHDIKLQCCLDDYFTVWFTYFPPLVLVCVLVVFHVVFYYCFLTSYQYLKLLYIFFSFSWCIVLLICASLCGVHPCVVCMLLHVCVCVPLYSGSLTQSTSMSHIEGVGKTWSKKPLRYDPYIQ